MSKKNPAEEKTIFFQSLGCAKNLVDTEVMVGISQKNRFHVVADPHAAEIIVVNTCGFIEDAKQESIDTILALASLKKDGRLKRLIVTGCLVQRYKADLMVSLPEVDAFVGTGQYNNLVDFVSGKKEEGEDFANPKYIHSEHTPRINSQPSHRAFLKISEGCIKNCTFCIIPKIRGKLRSRSVPSLVAEASQLVSEGVIELNLIAQNLTDYGKDRQDGTGLPDLLRALCGLPQLNWLRLLYTYPEDLNKDLIALMAEEPKICKYIDIPIQHISDPILKRMSRRQASEKKIRDLLCRLKTAIPELSLRSTLMVGYPGETQEDFEKLKSFVAEAHFEHLGVFAFSREEGTPTFDLEKQVDRETALERQEEILEIQREVSRCVMQERVGKTFPVLIKTPSEDPRFTWEKRHMNQAPEVDDCVFVRATDAKPGQIRSVRIEEALDYDLFGTVIS